MAAVRFTEIFPGAFLIYLDINNFSKLLAQNLVLPFIS